MPCTTVSWGNAVWTWLYEVWRNPWESGSRGKVPVVHVHITLFIAIWNPNSLNIMTLLSSPLLSSPLLPSPLLSSPLLFSPLLSSLLIGQSGCWARPVVPRHMSRSSVRNGFLYECAVSVLDQKTLRILHSSCCQVLVPHSTWCPCCYM